MSPNLTLPLDEADTDRPSLEEAASKYGATISDETPDDPQDLASIAKKYGATVVSEPLVPGNIDLKKQPRVQNPDGTVSTVRSISVNIDGKEVLIPTVVNGRVVSNDEAIKAYRRTGKHLGIFDSPDSATAFAKQLHDDYAGGKYDPAPSFLDIAKKYGGVEVAPEQTIPGAQPSRLSMGGKPYVEGQFTPEELETIGKSPAAQAAAGPPTYALPKVTPPDVQVPPDNVYTRGRFTGLPSGSQPPQVRDPLLTEPLWEASGKIEQGVRKLFSPPKAGGPEPTMEDIETQVRSGATPLTKENKAALSDIMEGGFRAMTPVAAMAAIVDLPGTLITAGLSYVSGTASEKAAWLAGADEETQRFLGNFGSLIGLLGAGSRQVQELRARFGAGVEAGQAERAAADVAGNQGFENAKPVGKGRAGRTLENPDSGAPGLPPAPDGDAAAGARTPPPTGPETPGGAGGGVTPIAPTAELTRAQRDSLPTMSLPTLRAAMTRTQAEVDGILERQARIDALSPGASTDPAWRAKLPLSDRLAFEQLPNRMVYLEALDAELGRRGGDESAAPAGQGADTSGVGADWASIAKRLSVQALQDGISSANNPRKKAAFKAELDGRDPEGIGSVGRPDAVVSGGVGTDWANIARGLSDKALSSELEGPAKRGDFAKRKAFEDEVEARRLGLRDADAGASPKFGVQPSAGAIVGERPERFKPIVIKPADVAEVVAEPRRDYASTQANLPDEHAAAVRSIAKQIISKKDLAAGGFEDQPHITVKFGIHDHDSIDKVREILANEGPITVTLGKLTHFADVQDGKADAVVAEVDSPDLHRLNKAISDAVPNTDTHPDYEPHVTLAYVKPGKGKDYDGATSLNGRKITLSSIAFAGKGEQQTEIPLTGTPAEDSIDRFQREHAEARARFADKPEDMGLWRALHFTRDASTRWEARKASGLSDAELKEAIGEEFGAMGGVSGSKDQGHDNIAMKGGKDPSFHYGSMTIHDSPGLKGKALVEAVRKLLDIPQRPTATFLGYQPNVDGGADALYNVSGGPHDRSTVSAKKLQELGIVVPETPTLEAWKANRTPKPGESPVAAAPPPKPSAPARPAKAFGSTWMNEADIEHAVQRFKDHPVLGPAARFLEAFKDEVNRHSDGWPYWKQASHAAGKLQGLLSAHLHAGMGVHPKQDEPIAADVHATMGPIKAFMTKHGTKAGITLPTLDLPVDKQPVKAKAEKPEQSPFYVAGGEKHKDGTQIVFRDGKVVATIYQDKEGDSWSKRVYVGAQLTQEGSAGDSREEALVAAKTAFERVREEVAHRATVPVNRGGTKPVEPKSKPVIERDESKPDNRTPLEKAKEHAEFADDEDVAAYEYLIGEKASYLGKFEKKAATLVKQAKKDADHAKPVSKNAYWHDDEEASLLEAADTVFRKFPDYLRDVVTLPLLEDHADGVDSVLEDPEASGLKGPEDIERIEKLGKLITREIQRRAGQGDLLSVTADDIAEVLEPADVDKDDEDVDNGRPRRNAVESHALEEALSPKAQAALAKLFKTRNRSKDLRHIREAMEVYGRLLDGGHTGDAIGEAGYLLRAAESFFTKQNPSNADHLDHAAFEGLKTITGEEDPDPAELLENEVFASAQEAGRLIFDTLDPKAPVSPELMNATAALPKNVTPGKANEESRYAGEDVDELAKTVEGEQVQRLKAIGRLRHIISASPDRKDAVKKPKWRTELASLEAVYDGAYSEFADAAGQEKADALRARVEARKVEEGNDAEEPSRGVDAGQLPERGGRAPRTRGARGKGALGTVSPAGGRQPEGGGAVGAGDGNSEGVVADAVPDRTGADSEPVAEPDSSGVRIEESASVPPAGDTHDPGRPTLDYVLTPERVRGVIDRGPVKRAEDNLAAIKLVKQLTAEARYATVDEQDVLAKYVGWGASDMANRLAEYADPRWSGNEKRIWQELKDALTDEEREKLRDSSPYAHFTYDLFGPMWKAMERAGFTGGRVLEPSVGTGHAFGMMPPDARVASVLNGVELEPITAAIAHHLYPSAKIQAVGFEAARLARGTQDLIIGNPPFGGFGITDKRAPDYATNRIHGYFFWKAIEMARPGGLVMFIATHYMLDSTETVKLRRELMNVAEFVGAVRLPNTAFDKSAKTEVVTDIIVLRKLREGEKAQNADLFIQAPEKPEMFTPAGYNNGSGRWQPESRVYRSSWFDKHPELVLGVESNKGTMRGASGEYTVSAHKDVDFAKDLTAALGEILPPGSYTPMTDEPTAPGKKPEAPVVVEGAFKPGEYRVGTKKGTIIRVAEDGTVSDATPMKKAKGDAKPVVDTAAVERMAGMIAIRDARKAVVEAMMNPASGKAFIEQQQSKLTHAYERFVKPSSDKPNWLNSPTNKRLFALDPESATLLALEVIETKAELVKGKDGKKVLKLSHNVVGRNDIFTQRTINAPREVTHVDTPKDALLSSLGVKGRIDWPYMAQLFGGGTSKAAVGLLKEKLKDEGLVFEQPDSSYVLAEEYLSGDVVTKLEDVEQADEPKRFAKNIDALKAVLPRPRTADDIMSGQVSIGINSHWVPPTDIAAFIAEQLGVSPRNVTLRLHGSEAMVRWDMTTTHEAKTSSTRHPLAVHYYNNHKVYTFLDLVSDALNVSMPDLGHSEGYPPNQVWVKEPEATMAARANQELLRQAWFDYVFSHPDVQDRLLDIYNERFNRTVERQYDGSHMQYPGMATLTNVHGEELKFFPHQNRGVWRILTSGNTLLAHEVGAGKTFEMIAAAMEMRRTGRANKPMIVVPTYLLSQWRQDIIKLYPSARLLAFDEKDLEKKKRQVAMSRIAHGNWDIVLVPHSSFQLLKVSDARMIKVMEVWRDELEEAQAEAERQGGKKQNSVKAMAQAKRKIQDKIDAKTDRLNKGTDNALTWEQLGVDSLMIDEAQAFKNLFFFSKIQNMRGLSRSESDRSLDLFVKVQDINEQSGHRNLVLATATPVMNGIAEIFTMQRYLQPQTLRQYGVENFDNWYAMFAKALPTTERQPDGTYKEVMRLRDYQNLQTLSRMVREVMDYVGWADMPYLKLPKIKGGAVRIIETEQHPMWPILQKWFEDRMYQLKLTPPHIVQATGEYVAPDRKDPITGESMGRFDNILAVMTDAKKAAVDVRLVLGNRAKDWAGSRIQKAADEMVKVWKAEADRKGVVLMFLDMGTPHNPPPLNFLKDVTTEDETEGEFNEPTDEDDDQMAAVDDGEDDLFNLYDALKQELVKRGVPANEIAYIHQAKNPAERIALFQAANRGDVRFVFASTDKGGVGMNIQTRLAAIHEIDAPRAQRPGDLRQRMGRGIRQGNTYAEVELARYVTKGTTDEWLWGLLTTKDYQLQKFYRGEASNITEDDPSTMSLEEAQIRATGDPRGVELTELKGRMARLESQAAAGERAVALARADVQQATTVLNYQQKDLADLKAWLPNWASKRGDAFEMSVGTQRFDKRADADEALLKALRAVVKNKVVDSTHVATIGGLRLLARDISGVRREFKGKGSNETIEVPYRAVDLYLDETPLGAGSVEIGRVNQKDYHKPETLGEGQNLITSITNEYERIPQLQFKIENAIEDAEKRISQSERVLAHPPEAIEALKASRARVIALENELRAEGEAKDKARAAAATVAAAPDPAGVDGLESIPEGLTLSYDHTNLGIVFYDGSDTRKWYEAGGRYFTDLKAAEAYLEGPDGDGGGNEPQFERVESNVVPFYSAMRKAVEAKMPKSAIGKHVLATLKNPQSGVKAEELQWSGLESWLSEQGDKPVTKAAVLAFIDQNEVTVGEKVLGDKAEPGNYSVVKADDGVVSIVRPDGVAAWSSDGRHGAAGHHVDVSESEYERLVAEWHGKPWPTDVMHPTKFDSHVLPGGENYRELLLTLPYGLKAGEKDRIQSLVAESERLGVEWGENDRAIARAFEASRAAGRYEDFREALNEQKQREARQAEISAEIERLRQSDTRFTGGHYYDPNVLVHVRFNDRVDGHGRKVLFVEEVQSDWHQQGRKRGYRKVGRPEIKTRPIAGTQFWEVVAIPAAGGEPVVLTTERMSHRFAMGEAERLRNDGVMVPDAPFKKTWHELAMKRMLRYAAEHGYDVLAWTPGDVQNDRYSLSKKVDQIQWDDVGGRKEDGKFVEILLKDDIQTIGLVVNDEGRVVDVHSAIGGDMNGKSLEDVIGKDVSERIMSSTSGVLKGEGLDLGGGGMRGFYDKILPDFMRRYTKQWGAEVGTVKIKVPEDQIQQRWDAHDEPVHGVDVTPAMRQSVMEKGQPLFEVTRAAAGDALVDKFDADRRAALKADYDSIPVDGDNVPVYDTGRRLTAAEAAQLAMNPDMQTLATTIQDVVERIATDILGPARYGIERIGLLFDRDAHGVFFPDPTDKRGGMRHAKVLINPFEWILKRPPTARPADIAASVYGTMVHEVTHWEVSGHGDDFKSALAANMAKMESYRSEAWRRLTEAYGNSDGTEGFREGLVEALSLYQGATRREPSTPDALSRKGGYAQRSQDEVDRPGGMVGRPEQDRIRTATKLAVRMTLDEVRGAGDGMRWLFAPDTRSSASRGGAATLRPHIAARDQKIAKAHRDTRAFERLMDGWSEDEAMRFWDVMEGTAKMSTLDPQSQEIAKTYRDILDYWRSEVTRRGLIRNYIEHYWGHEWVREPGTLQKVIRRLFNRKPMQGPESYRKRRKIPTMREGIEDYKLQPVSWNPTTQLLRKITEMAKSVAAFDVKEDFKRNGFMKYVPEGRRGSMVRSKKLPQHWVEYPPEFVGTVYGPDKFPVKFDDEEMLDEAGDPTERTVVGEPTFGKLVAGRYYGPPEVVQIVKNHLSAGLWGKSMLFDGYRRFGNFLNGVQLSWSLFHMWLTGMESIVSKQALVLDLLQRGQWTAAAKKQAEVGPQSVVIDLIRGNKGLKAFYAKDADATSEALNDVLNQIIQGGGGFGWSSFEHESAPQKFMTAMRTAIGAIQRRDMGRATVQGGKAAALAPFALVELPTLGIMNAWVPRLKAAAFLELAQMELQTLGPDAEIEDVRKVLGEVWDSIDNRFGQLRYDNLFWNNAFKHLSMASVRAVGWNVGSLREMFGAFPAQAGRIRDNAVALAAGGSGALPPGPPAVPMTGAGVDDEGNPKFEPQTNPWLHRKMAWFISMLWIYGLTGALYMYLMTGKRPETIRDYFFPQDGTKDSQGKPRRRSVVGYFRDLYSWVTHPVTTAAHKAQSLLTIVYEILSNEDFAGVEVHEQGKVPFLNLEDMQFVWQQFRPFSLSNAERTAESSMTDVQKFTHWLGQAVSATQPAPAVIERSKAESLLHDWGELDHRTKTREQAADNALTRQIREGMKSGTPEGRKRAQEAIRSGELSKRQIQTAEKAAEKKQTFLQFGFQRQPLDRALQLYEVATPQERYWLRPLLLKKADTQLLNAPSNDRKALFDRYHAALKLERAR